MLKRWIIRGVFLGVVALCVVGWGWSGWYQGGVDFEKGGYYGCCGTQFGVVVVGYGPTHGRFNIWYSEIDSVPRQRWWPPMNPMYSRFLGFVFQNNGAGDWVIGIPYWFLIMIFSMVLFYVWWKTGSGIVPARAFPVEVGRD